MYRALDYPLGNGWFIISSKTYRIRIEYSWNDIISFILQNTMHLTEILNIFVMLFWASVQIFIFCELGENLTERFNRIPIIIYDSEWYNFPKDVRRALPTVMIAAQQPMVLQGFANLKCTRESFKKVTTHWFCWEENEIIYIILWTISRSFKADFHILSLFRMLQNR